MINKIATPVLDRLSDSLEEARRLTREMAWRDDIPLESLHEPIQELMRYYGILQRIAAVEETYQQSLAEVLADIKDPEPTPAKDDAPEAATEAA